MSSSNRDVAVRRTSPSGMSASAWSWTDLGSTFGNARELEDDGRSENVAEEAYRRGFAEGIDSARSEARVALEYAVKAATRVVEDVRISREAWLSDLRRNLATLATGIAASVIDRSVNEDPRIFEELVDKIIAAFPLEDALKIRLNPADHAAITAGEAGGRIAGSRTIRWIPDVGVVRGGCLVEGPDRIVDARVDEALRRVIRALTDD